MRVVVLMLIFVMSSSAVVHAQDLKNRRLIKADLAFDNEQYFVAAELYKKAYKKTKNRALKAEIIFKQAECYRKSLNYKRASSYYKRAIKIADVQELGDVMINQLTKLFSEDYKKTIH